MFSLACGVLSRNRLKDKGPAWDGCLSDNRGNRLRTEGIPLEAHFHSGGKSRDCVGYTRYGLKRWTVTVSPISNEVRSSPTSSGPL